MRPRSRRKPLDTAAAVEAALAGLLARRDYATREALDLLVERGADPAVAQAAVSGFVARGYLDDARFAERYVSYAARRGLGPLRIERELRDRGVAAAVAAEALQAGHDWTALCDELRRRRFGAAAPDSWAEKGRQARFLQYRGFSSDHMRLTTGFDPSDNLPSENLPPEDPEE